MDSGILRGSSAAIRVLVADDSAVTRAILRDIFDEAPDLVVAGEAADGDEAISQTLLLKPDLVLIDINMPVRDGLSAIEEIMAVQPVPILVLAAATDERDVLMAFSAIKRGALDVMLKPAGAPQQLREDGMKLVEKVRMLSRIRVIRHTRALRRDIVAVVPAAPAAEHSVLGIGASTGGPKAVMSIVKALPPGFPGSIFIVQHIAAGFTAGFAQWLNRESRIHVRMAEEGDVCRRGEALVAPDGYHLTLDNGRVKLLATPPVHSCRPSIDIFFSSLAEQEEKVVGVLLTGMGRDGAQGLRQIRDRGGYTIVQDEMSSAVFGMPKAAIALKAVDRILPLGEIPEALLQLFNGTSPKG